MKTHFLKILIGGLLISVMTAYHYKITQLDVFTTVGFTYELLLVMLFLVGVELGKSINNNQLKKEEDAEE